MKFKVLPTMSTTRSKELKGVRKTRIMLCSTLTPGQEKSSVSLFLLSRTQSSTKLSQLWCLSTTTTTLMTRLLFCTASNRLMGGGKKNCNVFQDLEINKPEK